MTLFYKTAFKPYYDLCRSKRKQQPVSDFIVKYVQEEYPGLFESLPSE